MVTMEPIISVRNFKKSFGEKEVHKDVSVDVYDRECLGLIGGSGQGKSVILRSLIGLEKPDSGMIKIEGEEISGYTENQLVEIRKKVAYCFQNGALFDSMTIEDNITFFAQKLYQLNKASKKELAAEKLDGRGGVVEEVRAVPDAEVVEVSAPVVSEVKSSLKIVV